jgi:hypothetical protein
MLSKIYTSEDYSDLCAWWSKHGHPIISSEVLPFGIVVENNGVKHAMTFVYTMDGCNAAQIAWTTTNPELGLKARYKAVNQAIDTALVYINSKKINNIMCFSDSMGLSKLLNKRGLRLGNDHILCIGSF